MKKILFLLIFSFIFIYGCSESETMLTGATTALDVVEEPVEAEPEEPIEVIEEIEENIKTVKLCYDSDNGIVRWEKGKIFGFYDNATRFEFEDYCRNFNYLIEFYCEEENPKDQIFLCTNGCVDNHCA